MEFTLTSRSQPFHESGHLDRVHSHFSFRDNESEVLNLCLFKLTLLLLEVEFVLVKPFHYPQDYPPVLCQRLGEYQDVIQVHTDHPFHDEVTEDVIHHCLKGGWAVGELEEHDQWFEEPLVGLEGHLPLGSLGDVHIVVSPPDIELGEVLGTLELVYELRDERDWVLVLHGHGIQGPVILHRPVRSSL